MLGCLVVVNKLFVPTAAGSPLGELPGNLATIANFFYVSQLRSCNRGHRNQATGSLSDVPTHSKAQNPCQCGAHSGTVSVLHLPRVLILCGQYGASPRTVRCASTSSTSG
ncbi:hypothetical protein C8R47DRAFT_1103110 [Mycena vitilis]|nr:hypothetical protein C8R47DRAFT_1103110 [Mycena vitilis]